jgi:hypothetical protein
VEGSNIQQTVQKIDDENGSDYRERFLDLTGLTNGVNRLSEIDRVNDVIRALRSPWRDLGAVWRGYCEPGI